MHEGLQTKHVAAIAVECMRGREESQFKKRPPAEMRTKRNRRVAMIGDNSRGGGGNQSEERMGRRYGAEAVAQGGSRVKVAQSGRDTRARMTQAGRPVK